MTLHGGSAYLTTHQFPTITLLKSIYWPPCLLRCQQFSHCNNPHWPLEIVEPSSELEKWQMGHQVGWGCWIQTCGVSDCKYFQCRLVIPHPWRQPRSCQSLVERIQSKPPGQQCLQTHSCDFKRACNPIPYQIHPQCSQPHRCALMGPHSSFQQLPPLHQTPQQTPTFPQRFSSTTYIYTNKNYTPNTSRKSNPPHRSQFWALQI